MNPIMCRIEHSTLRWQKNTHTHTIARIIKFIVILYYWCLFNVAPMILASYRAILSNFCELVCMLTRATQQPVTAPPRRSRIRSRKGISGIYVRTYVGPDIGPHKCNFISPCGCLSTPISNSATPASVEHPQCCQIWYCNDCRWKRGWSCQVINAL